MTGCPAEDGRVDVVARRSLEAVTDADASQRRDKHRARHGTARHHQVLRRVAIALGAALVLAVGLGVAAYAKLSSNISRVDVSAQVGTDRPVDRQATAAAGPLNILVLGSDNRSQLGTTRYGTETGARSDTTLLVHLSADRTSVTVVSIPRDSMVLAPPGCSPNAPKSQWRVRQWNLAFNDGGTGCVIHTLEANTGVFVNHYAVVNFTGFKGMVDALGGVDVCTPEPINDRDSGLTLGAGRHHINGIQALGYVRVRETVGDGSDLGRIARQQAFMASVAQGATSSSLLLRPDKLFAFLSAATESLTTDPGFSVGTMKDVAESVKSVGTGRIQFVTVPTEQYPADHNRVQWAAGAGQIWQALRDDRAVNQKPRAVPWTAPAVTVSPAQVFVEVVNASGVPGVANQAQRALQVQGFPRVTVGNGAMTSGTVVEYGAGRAEAAKTVSAAFPGSTMKQVSGLGALVRVVMGAGAANVVEVANRLGSAALPAQPLSATVPAVKITTRRASDSICS